MLKKWNQYLEVLNDGEDFSDLELEEENDILNKGKYHILREEYIDKTFKFEKQKMVGIDGMQVKLWKVLN